MLKKLETLFMTPDWKNEYDAARKADIASKGKKVKVTKLDSENKPLFTEIFENGNVIKSTSRDGDETQYFYNNDGKLITTVFTRAKDGKVTTIEYYHDRDGRVCRSICTETGLVAEYFYNKDNTLDTVKSSLPGRKPFVSKYTYDEDGRVLTCHDRKGTTTYEYDDDEKTVHIINNISATKKDPAKVEESWETYDAYGRVTVRQKGKRVTMEYDYTQYIEQKESATFGKTKKPARFTTVEVLEAYDHPHTSTTITDSTDAGEE